MTDPLVHLAMELINAVVTLADDDEGYVEYIERRVQEDVRSRADATLLVTYLAVFAAGAVTEWAAETERTPWEVLQAMAADLRESDTP